MVDIVRYYFNKNYTYGVVLYFLEEYHGKIIASVCCDFRLCIVFLIFVLCFT